MSNVYIHYPYCETRCPYCDFFKTTADEEPAYWPTLKRELELWRRFISSPLETIYFGGGTPGRMATDRCAEVLKHCADLWGMTADCEVTLEMNPGDADPDLVARFAAAGVNRLSIGVQSLRDAELAFLGRRHRSAESRAAVAAARRGGITNLSLDLIFGLPGQTIAQLDESLDGLAALAPDHVSLYGLSFEAGTDFGRALAEGRMTPLDRDLWLAMYERVCGWATETMGFEHYEISSFGSPGMSSRHNRHYWRDGSWVGAGPGAHGQVLSADGSLLRRFNPRGIKGWMEAVGQWTGDDLLGGTKGEHLDPARYLRERAMVGVRDLFRGIDPVTWAEESGQADSALIRTVEAFVLQGDLSTPAPHRLMPAALKYSDRVAEALLNA
jgi:putative oxygen-independent coproporphyrinogen III oxidase